MRFGAPVLGIPLGLVLLGGTVGFVVGLQGDGTSPTAEELRSDPFPAELGDGSLVTVDRLDPIEGVNVSPEQLAAALQEQAEYAEGRRRGDDVRRPRPDRAGRGDGVRR